jgi:hydrogenase nickel incorporation protein HypA/HybF
MLHRPEPFLYGSHTGVNRLVDVHELSICTAIAKIAHQAAAGRPVERVRVDIGHLRQVVPDTLRHSWEMVVFGTELDSVPLEVREVPAVIECRTCGARTELDVPILRCGQCGSTGIDVVSGDELLVTSLDVTVD